MFAGNSTQRERVKEAEKAKKSKKEYQDEQKKLSDFDAENRSYNIH